MATEAADTTIKKEKQANTNKAESEAGQSREWPGP
jgi:hypothetical protein